MEGTTGQGIEIIKKLFRKRAKICDYPERIGGRGELWQQGKENRQ